MKKYILLLLLAALLLAGCGREQEEAEGFLFTHNGVTIAMDQEAGPVLYRLGAPLSCSQTPSCAFQGMDTTYFHGSFYITTYPAGSAEHISGLWFADDTVATQEGIRLGSTRAEVEEAYGAQSIQEGSCILTRGNSMLTIVLEEDLVCSIEYSLVFD